MSTPPTGALSWSRLARLTLSPMAVRSPAAPIAPRGWPPARDCRGRKVWNIEHPVPLPVGILRNEHAPHGRAVLEPAGQVDTVADGGALARRTHRPESDHPGMNADPHLQHRRR